MSHPLLAKILKCLLKFDIRREKSEDEILLSEDFLWPLDKTRQGNMKATADVFDILKFDLNVPSFGLACAGCGSVCKQHDCRLLNMFD